MSEDDDATEDDSGPEAIEDHVQRVRDLLHDTSSEEAAADD